MPTNVQLLKSVRRDFESASRKYGTVHHELINGDISKLPSWLGEKLMDDLHFLNTKGLSRMVGGGDRARKLFDGLVRRAAIGAGLSRDDARTWLEFVYKRIDPGMVKSDSLGQLSIRVLLIDPFAASGMVIGSLLPQRTNGPAVADGGGGAHKPAKGKRRKTTGQRLKDKPLTEPQRTALEKLLECKGNKTETAMRLGISRSALDDRLKGVKLRGELAKNRSVKSRSLPKDKRGQANIGGDDPQLSALLNS